MKTTGRSHRSLSSIRCTIAVGAIVMTAVACATPVGMYPSASVTTTTPGVTERWFKIDWSGQATGDRLTIDGHVENVSGRPMARVQLLVQSLDASGNVVSQRLHGLGGGLPNGARQFFEVRNVPTADHYNVSVWAYDIIESGGGGIFQ